MTDPCDRWEIEIERRAHGALGPGEAEALAAHLAGCGRCQAFAGLVGQVNSRLQQDASVAAREADWPAIERRVEERARRMRRSGWLVPSALLGAAALSFALGLPLKGALLMGSGALLTTAIARQMSTRWLRDLEQAQASREGLLAFSRQQVEAELRAAKIGAVALVWLALVQVAAIELLGRPALGSRVAVFAGALLLLAGAGQLGLREAPRLRREREELS
jgi:anti-sigma factor RsiW